MNEFPSFSKIEPRQREEDELQLASDATPLDGLRAIYTNTRIPLYTRLKAMIEAAPYCHPKLSVTATIDGRDFASRLEKAIANSRRVMIEAPQERSKVDEFADL
jgi:hypothetical protein